MQPPARARAAAAAQVFVDDLEVPVVGADDAHHLASVLRIRPGEAVVASDGAGSWRLYEVVIGSAGPSRPGRRRPDGEVRLEPTTDRFFEERATPAITVAFALAKGERPEWAVQKLVEVGADRLVPVVTDRSVVRPSGAAGADRAERFRRVAVQAAMQCRRVWLAEVSDVTPLLELQDTAPGIALGAPEGDEPSLERPAIAVGPEGGFTAEELARAGALVRLGPHVLRTETAAVVAGTLLASLRAGLVFLQRHAQ